MAIVFFIPGLICSHAGFTITKANISAGLRNMRDTLFAFRVGFMITQFILPHTVIYIPVLALALFHTYYHLNRGGSFWLVLMLLICLLLMPMLAGVYEGLAIGVVSGLVGSSWLTICLLWLAHYIVPDAVDGPGMPAAKGYQPGYSAPAATFALKSTMVALPIALVFLANNWTSQILVMVFAAIFTLSPNLDKGKEAGMNSITSTVIGGAAAFFVYWLLVAVPEYYFLITLMFFASLSFGAAINSTMSMAKYLPSAMVAMIILVNSSLAEDVSFTDVFVKRILFISLAAVYVVITLRVLDAFWPKQRVSGNQSAVAS